MRGSLVRLLPALFLSLTMVLAAALMLVGSPSPAADVQQVTSQGCMPPILYQANQAC